MDNICAVPCHIWSHMSLMVTLVFLGHMCHMYLCLNIYIIPYLSLKPGKSLFLVIHFVWETTLTRSHISQEVAFPGSHISSGVFQRRLPRREVGQRGGRRPGDETHRCTYPRKTHFPGSHISREVTFPGKSNFSGKS